MRTVSWICAILLFLSIFPLSSWFTWISSWYTILWESFTCAGALWLAWKDYRDKSLATWNLALVMIAILYNPIFPIEIASSYISAAIALLCVLFFLVFAYKRNISSTES